MTAAIRAIGQALLSSLLSKGLLEWALFYVADLIVKSTHTPHDDKFLDRLREAYRGETK